jgi:hypothetical protein
MTMVIMKKYSLLMLLPIASLFITACGEEEIELNLKSTKTHLVVDGIITTDTMAHCVKLTLSGDYFYNKPLPRVSGAVVQLSDGVETIVLTESTDAPGCYFTPDDYFGKENHLYQLEVSGVNAPGIKSSDVFSAESFLNPLLPVDYISVEYLGVWKLWKVLLYMQDSANYTNYYLFKVFRNGLLVTDKYSKMSVVDDKFFDGNYANGVWIAALDATKEAENILPGDTISVETYMIDKAYYDFIFAAQIETTMKNPIFSGPPANVPSNISNGALGSFAACAVYRNSVINTASAD